MADIPSDKEFLEFVIKALVDNPEKVDVQRTVDEMGVLLTLKVDPADMGRVIGGRGRTAAAIRLLVRLVGLRHNARVNLKIEEPEGASRPARRDFHSSAAPTSSVGADDDSDGNDDDSTASKVMDDLDNI